MNLAFGSVFVFLGCAMLAYASHTHESSTPWGAYQAMIGKMRGEPVGT